MNVILCTPKDKAADSGEESFPADMQPTGGSIRSAVPPSVSVWEKSPDSFSYAEVIRTFRAGDPGVKKEGFVNTEPTVLDGIADVKVRAVGECTVEYKMVSVSYDKTAEIWEVTFWMGTPGGGQSVYMDRNGVTRLIIYGE